MPRIYARNNDPLDFCRAHMPTRDVAEVLYGGAIVGDGPDGRGDYYDYDAEHPNYDWDTVYCERCDVLLGERDN